MHNPVFFNDPSGLAAAAIAGPAANAAPVILVVGGVVIVVTVAYLMTPEGQQFLAGASWAMVDGVELVGAALNNFVDSVGNLASNVRDGITGRGGASATASSTAIAFGNNTLSVGLSCITVAVNDLNNANKRNHILQDKHNWGNLVPDPRDPHSWHEIAAAITLTLTHGAEQLYKNGPAFIKSLEISPGKIVDVTYRIIDGVVRISDAWIR